MKKRKKINKGDFTLFWKKETNVWGKLRLSFLKFGSVRKEESVEIVD